MTQPRRSTRRVFLRQTALLGTAAAASPLLMACSPSGGDQGGGGGAADQPVTYLSWDGKTTMQPLIDAFQKQSGITVQASYATPVAPYVQKLQTQLSSNTAPDVFIMAAENKAPLLASGAVLDLSGFAWTSVLSESARKTYTADGKLWGVSPASWGAGYLVNDELLGKAGATSVPTAWDDFVGLCRELKGRGVTAVYDGPAAGFPTTLGGLLGIVDKTMGGTMASQIWARQLTFADAWTDSLVRYNQLYEEGLSPRNSGGLTGEQQQQAFAQKDVAMTAGASFDVSTIKKSAPDVTFRFSAIPGPGGATFWEGAVNQAWAINAKSKNQENAAKFLEYIFSSAGIELYQKTGELITTTTNFTPQLDPSLKEMATGIRSDDFYFPIVAWPDHASEMSQQATALLEEMVQGKRTPQQVAQGMDEKLSTFK